MSGKGVIDADKVDDQWLSLMSTQAAPGATLIFHGNFDLKTYSIPIQGYFGWLLLVNMFPLIYGTPHNSSWFEIYLCLKLLTPVSGLKPHGVVA